MPEKFKEYLLTCYFRDFNIETGDCPLARNSIAHGVSDAADYDEIAATLPFFIFDQIFYFLPGPKQTDRLHPLERKAVGRARRLHRGRGQGRGCREKRGLDRESRRPVNVVPPMPAVQGGRRCVRRSQSPVACRTWTDAQDHGCRLNRLDTIHILESGRERTSSGAAACLSPKWPPRLSSLLRQPAYHALRHQVRGVVVDPVARFRHRHQRQVFFQPAPSVVEAPGNSHRSSRPWNIKTGHFTGG